MPGKITPFNSTTARAAALKSNAVRAAQAAARRRAAKPPPNAPDSLPERLALEREGLLELLAKEQRKHPPQPVRIKRFIEAIGKLLEIERKLKREGGGRNETHGRARPTAEPVSSTPGVRLAPGDSPERKPTPEPPSSEPPQPSGLSDYPG